MSFTKYWQVPGGVLIHIYINLVVPYSNAEFYLQVVKTGQSKHRMVSVCKLVKIRYRIKLFGASFLDPVNTTRGQSWSVSLSREVIANFNLHVSQATHAFLRMLPLCWINMTESKYSRFLTNFWFKNLLTYSLTKMATLALADIL